MIGQCLCGQIEFEFVPVGDTALRCYCSICQRSHGADCATQLISKKSSLRFISGDSLVAEYSSSPMGVRAFCSNCGARLMNYAKAKSDYMSVALACVISDHKIKPVVNVQVASKPQWAQPDDSVPCFDEFPADITKYL